jgi:hypothetical protein
MTAFRDRHRSGLVNLPIAWDGAAAALTRDFLEDGRSEPLIEGALDWGALNALMPQV